MIPGGVYEAPLIHLSFQGEKLKNIYSKGSKSQVYITVKKGIYMSQKEEDKILSIF